MCTSQLKFLINPDLKHFAQKGPDLVIIILISIDYLDKIQRTASMLPPCKLLQGDGIDGGNKRRYNMMK